MARMLPDLSELQLRNFKSEAEAIFYRECRRQLADEIVVIHSASWLYRDGSNRLREGEADFVILDPASGIFAVEAKGGGVSFDPESDQWRSLSRAGTTYEIKDPFRQASLERHSIQEQLFGHAAWKAWRGSRLTVGHAVALPDVHDLRKLLGPDRPRKVIAIDDDIAALSEWYSQLVVFWRHTNDDRLGHQGAQLALDILFGSVEVRPALRSLIDQTEQARIVLTRNQAKILRIIGGRRRAVISGGAGTGKTLIAVEKARTLAAQGCRVMLLCYNRPLANSLALAVRDEPRIFVSSFHQLCEQRIAAVRKSTGRDLLSEAKDAYPGADEKYLFEVQMPYALALSNEAMSEKFDAIVVDEAQDFSEDYWFALEELLEDPEAGSFFIFIDENQSLYKRQVSLPVSDQRFFLTTNCRNTVPIHRAGYAHYSGEEVDEPSLPGQDVLIAKAESDGEQANAVVLSVRRLLEDGIRPEDIVVLLAKRPKARLYAMLQARGLPNGIRWSVESGTQRNSVHIDTVARFKGLEANAVVLWLGDEIADECQAETIYVGVTRAKSLLCLVGSDLALSYSVEKATNPHVGR